MAKPRKRRTKAEAILHKARTEPSAPAPPDPATPEEAPRETLDERRARVHAKAEAAIAEMQEPPA